MLTIVSKVLTKKLEKVVVIASNVCMITNNDERFIVERSEMTKQVKRTKMTKAEILAIVKASAETNKAKSAKAFYTDKGAETLMNAIAKALTLPTLASAGIGNGKGEGEARRKFCRQNKAIAVDPNKVLRLNNSARPENAIDQRLMKVAVLMGMNPKAFYAVRSTPTNSDKEPKVYIVCR